MTKRRPDAEREGAASTAAWRPELDGHGDAGDATAGEQVVDDRLADTIAELMVCLDDGQRIVELGRDRLEADWMVRRAVRNVISELGETVGRLPQRFMDEHPDINWRAIAGMRNRTVHGYQHTNYAVVWDTLTENFPQLRRAIESSTHAADDG